MKDLNLGILDFGIIKPSRINSHEVINSVLSDVATYEELGFERYWLAEHYSTEFAWFSPEMLLPLLAGYTEKIKIGWTGVLLNVRSPLSVAGNMRLLSALYHGRIDVGVARAPAAEEYLRKLTIEKTPWVERLNSFIELINGDWHDEETNEHLFVPPHATPAPNLWNLTISHKSIDLSVKNKMNFAISFIHPGSNYEANIDTIKRYKEAYFEAHGTLPKTSVLLGVGFVQDERAKRVLDNRFNTPGRLNLFGCGDCIVSELHEIKSKLGNDEFSLYMPRCNRKQRLDHYARIIETA